MERCETCGARLAPGATWCGQCYAPVTASSSSTPGPPSQGPDIPLWRRSGAREPGPGHAVAYSRFRPGPTSFGALGRSLLTLLLLAALVVGYPMARGGMLAAIGFDIPGRPFLIAYSVCAGAAGLYLLARIWKRARVV